MKGAAHLTHFAPVVHARVTSAPLGTGAAIVQTARQHLNRRIDKKFTFPKKLSISDPTHAVRAGDTVAIARWPSLSPSKRIIWTVTQIIAPWGRDGAAPLSSRPAVWTEEQRRQWRHDYLLKNGTLNTQRGLRNGSLYIGEEGKIMSRVKQAEAVEEAKRIEQIMEAAARRAPSADEEAVAGSRVSMRE